MLCLSLPLSSVLSSPILQFLSWTSCEAFCCVIVTSTRTERSREMSWLFVWESNINLVRYLYSETLSLIHCMVNNGRMLWCIQISLITRLFEVNIHKELFDPENDRNTMYYCVIIKKKLNDCRLSMIWNYMKCVSCGCCRICGILISLFVCF